MAFLVMRPSVAVAPPDRLRREAAEARAAAIAARARAWAPIPQGAAERAWQAATREESLQFHRPAWRRDYAAASRGYSAALANARLAHSLANRRAGAAEVRARRSLRAAEAVLSLARRLRDATGLSRDARVATARATLDVEHARRSFEAGDFLEASARAEAAAASASRALELPMERAGRYARPDDVRRWLAAFEATREWSRATGRAAIVVIKDEHQLVLIERGRETRRYAAELGRNALPAKQQEGDAATPEGEYRVVRLRDRGETRYHRALLVDYPNDHDRRRFRDRVERGELSSRARLGGLIEIHGEGGRGWNWTDGCVALRNEDMDELFSRIDVGTPVTIIGGRGDGVFSGLAADWEGLDRSTHP